MSVTMEDENVAAVCLLGIALREGWLEGPFVVDLDRCYGVLRDAGVGVLPWGREGLVSRAVMLMSVDGVEPDTSLGAAVRMVEWLEKSYDILEEELCRS